MSGPSSSKQVVIKPKPMSRPRHGRVGTPIDVEANFVRLAIPTRLKASQYAVQLFRNKTKRGTIVKQEVSATEAISFNRNCFAVLLDRYAHEFGCNLAYNGRSIAYAPTEINRMALGRTYTIRVNKDGWRPDTSDGKEEEIGIVLNHAKYLRYNDLFSGAVEGTSATEFITCLDVVLAPAAAVDHVQVGRSFYNSHDCVALGRWNITKSAWKGFYQSVRLSELGLVLNMDQSCTAFWNKGSMPLAQLLRDANNNRDLRCGNPRSLYEVAQKIKGLKVKAVHTGIVYRVHGFSNRGADRTCFDCNGQMISITQYFADTYGIALQNGGAPLVKTNPKRDTFVPIECLSIVPNQRVAGLLSQDETQTMVRSAVTKPFVRRKNAVTRIQELKYHEHPICRDFGIEVRPHLIHLKARVLSPPSIKYQQGVVRPLNGQWRAKNGVMNPARLLSWAVCNTSRLSQNEVEQFIRDLISAMNRAGLKMYMKNPKVYLCDEQHIEQKMREIALEFSRDKTLFMKNPCLQLLIVIKERQDSKVYNAIKREGDLNLGIATQVCLSKHCGSRSRGRDMYCDNVVLKINAKLGGHNGGVASYGESQGNRIPDVNFLNIPHIILGADVSHPSPGAQGLSVAALVGSRDREGLQFASAIRSQEGGQETITEIGEMFKEVYAVWYHQFQRKFHAYSIIMFRDGVSEGQFEDVMQREVEAIRKACKEISDKMRPSITYMIVTKRHHTRFFPASKGAGDRSGNVPPGTVVDTGITSKSYYDFYLNSHAGIQGTCKPSKYTVLIDENNIPPDALYGYIYRLSHSFSRCNRPVSMVHSAYYAHLLAFRGRAYIEDKTSDTASGSSGGSSIPAIPNAHGLLKGHLYFI